MLKKKFELSNILGEEEVRDIFIYPDVTPFFTLKAKELEMCAVTDQ
jgi:hypothetical protein